MARKLKKEPISRFLFSAPADFFTNSIFLFALSTTGIYLMTFHFMTGRIKTGF